MAQTQVYQDGRFSWLKKKVTLNIVAGVANLPSDCVISYGLDDVYDANFHEYTPVDSKDIQFLATADYRYWITWDATNKVFAFNTNQTTATLTAWYFIQPALMSGPTDTTPIPDPLALVWLATALWWSATEHDENLLQNPFYPKYQERLALMKAYDGANLKAPRAFRNKIQDMPLDTPSISSVRR